MKTLTDRLAAAIQSIRAIRANVEINDTAMLANASAAIASGDAETRAKFDALYRAELRCVSSCGSREEIRASLARAASYRQVSWGKYHGNRRSTF